MGLNFTKIGLTPGMAGSHTLPLLIGQQAASRMILTGDLISAKEALKLGVVLDIFPGSQNGTDDDASPLMIAANDLATRISSSSPVAVRATVKTLRMRVDDGLERALQREADTQAHCYAAEDMVEGLVKLVGE